MAMAAYAARRTLFYVIVFFAVTVLVFFSIHAATNAVATVFIDKDKPDLTLVRHTFVFEKPIVVQYVEWLKGFFIGNWGTATAEY